MVERAEALRHRRSGRVDDAQARIGLEEINEGFEAMKTGEIARDVIVFN